EISLLSASLLAGMHLDKGDVNEAIEIYDRIISENPGSSYAINSKFEKFFAVLNLKKDTNLAEKILSDIQSLPNEDEDFLLRKQIAEYLFYGILPGDSDLPINENNADKTRAKDEREFALIGSYPNPFNPNTTISYMLPYQSAVELIIYD